MSPSLQFPVPVNHSNIYDDHGHSLALLHQDSGRSDSTPSRSISTRTVAIIKTHALEQRLEIIEPRIIEADFEIVKERQMEFDTESDPETFFELFGEDARFLGDGPVWVYVLERRRAVPVLLSLLSSLNGAIIGAKSDVQAEMLISALFASSPPFPVSDLPSIASDRDFDRGSIRSVNSAVLEALQLGLETPVGSGHTLSPSPGSDVRGPGFTSTPRSLTESTSSSGNAQFHARPLPKTHLVPDIAPRLTKAALLRQGLNTDGSPRAEVKLKTRMSLASTGRIPLPRKDKENEAKKEKERERLKKTFAGVPGHKRTETITVASTAPPVIAPRLTKAAALRLGLEQPATPPGRKRMSLSGPPPKASVNGNGIKPGSPAMPQRGSTASANDADGEETETEIARKNTFDGVPGHKRRESFSVASTRPPSITPRLNKSAVLRKEGGPPPSSFMFRMPTEGRGPGSGMHSRSSSVMSAYRDQDDALWARPRSAIPPRTISRSSNVGAPLIQKTSSYSSQTSSSGTGTGPLSTASTTSNDSDEAPNGVVPPTRKVRRPSSLQAPTIAPRVNKSAVLRAQKQAADAAKPKSPWANASKR